MSDINQINEENASLERSLLSVKDEQGRAKELETSWNEKITAFNTSIKPLQDQFRQKLEDYLKISDEYYTKYIPAAAAQQRARLEKYAREMYKFMNYPVYYARLRNETSMKQSEWDNQNNQINTQYQNAMAEYNRQRSNLDSIIRNRETEANAGILASQTRRQQYQAQFSVDYMQKLKAAHTNRVYWLEYWTPVGGGRLGNGPRVLTGWLNAFLPRTGASGGGAIKRVHVIAKRNWQSFYPNKIWGITGSDAIHTINGIGGTPLPADLYGSAAITTTPPIWGPSIPKYKSGSYTSYTNDTVPKIIWYPHGSWSGSSFNNEGESFSIGQVPGWRIFFKPVWIDPAKVNDPASTTCRVFGQADDQANIYINGKLLNNSILRGGWGNATSNLSVTFNKQDYFYPGSNFILIQAKNTGGPGGVAVGMCSVYNDGPHWDDILVRTDETWWAVRSNINNSPLGTNHKGDSAGTNVWLQDKSWINMFHDDLKTKGWLGKIEGASGVSIHNYQPPEAKVRYVRVDFAQRPNQSIIQISQLAVYPTDNMEVNVAKGKSATAHSVYPSSSPNPSNAVDGTLQSRNFPSIYHSDVNSSWQDQYWEVDLGSGNAKEIYKIMYYNRNDCCQDRSVQTRLRLFDENRNLVFSGPPFGSSAKEQSFFFNHPIPTVGLDTNLQRPVKSDMDAPRPIFDPEPRPSHPVMTPWKTPDQQLLDKVMKAGDDLVTINMTIQDRYKRFATENDTAANYQGVVLQQRKQLLAGVMSLIKERSALGEEIQEYTKLSTNQDNLEKGAISSQIYSWIWMCVAVLSVILFFIFLIWPTYIQHSVPIISWTILILGTLLTTIFIGGNIAFLLWIFILVSIFFHLVNQRFQI